MHQCAPGEDTLACILGAPSIDDVMSYNSLTTHIFYRSSCLSQLRFNARTGCKSECQKCWNFCKKFGELERGSRFPDCPPDDVIGCRTARKPFFGHNDKAKNLLKPRKFAGQNLVTKFGYTLGIQFPFIQTMEPCCQRVARASGQSSKGCRFGSEQLR